MVDVRDILPPNKKKPQSSWLPWFHKMATTSVEVGKAWGTWAYMTSRYLGWIVITTGIITALPVLFEGKREMAIEELEKLQITQGLAEGRTPQELAFNQGLSAAIEPKVLK